MILIVSICTCSQHYGVPAVLMTRGWHYNVWLLGWEGVVTVACCHSN